LLRPKFFSHTNFCGNFWIYFTLIACNMIRHDQSIFLRPLFADFMRYIFKISADNMILHDQNFILIPIL
jgi:hypothetical protein